MRESYITRVYEITERTVEKVFQQPLFHTEYGLDESEVRPFVAAIFDAKIRYQIPVEEMWPALAGVIHQTMNHSKSNVPRLMTPLIFEIVSEVYGIQESSLDDIDRGKLKRLTPHQDVYDAIRNY